MHRTFAVLVVVSSRGGLLSPARFHSNRPLWRHCEEPTGPREARPDDRLREEAIHIATSGKMDCFASLAMTVEVVLLLSIYQAIFKASHH
jgi:hypothetical protein